MAILTSAKILPGEKSVFIILLDRNFAFGSFSNDVAFGNLQ